MHKRRWDWQDQDMPLTHFEWAITAGVMLGAALLWVLFVYRLTVYLTGGDAP